jgi:hypothetical protein
MEQPEIQTQASFVRGNSSSVTEIRTEESELRFVTSLVETNHPYLRVNSSFHDLCASLAVTSWINRDSNSALDLSVVVLTGRNCELQAQMISYLPSSALLTATIPTEGVLIAA